MTIFIKRLYFIFPYLVNGIGLGVTIIFMGLFLLLTYLYENEYDFKWYSKAYPILLMGILTFIIGLFFGEEESKIENLTGDYRFEFKTNENQNMS